MSDPFLKLNENHFKFHSPSKGELSFNQLVEEIFSYMKEKPHLQYEIVVGCDSPSGEAAIFFPVAVVVLRKGYGGRYFLQKIKYSPEDSQQFQNLHKRILQEVMLSCSLALILKEALFKRALKDLEANPQESPLSYQLQYIHADIGQSGPTRDMIKEVTGLIRSNGFVPKIKPESFAASIVADRFT